jgi:hypothetical protein
VSDGGISGGIGRTRVGNAPRQALGEPEAALDPDQHQTPASEVSRPPSKAGVHRLGGDR